MNDSLVGAFTEVPFPAARIIVSDTVRLGMERRRIPVLLELDVTVARSTIAQRESTGEDLSFTGWIMKCLAQAASEQPRVHAIRRGRHKLVLFEDVDVGFMVQRPSAYMPTPGIIRRANDKSVEAITAEIRAAQSRDLTPGQRRTEPAMRMPSPATIRAFASLPFFVRKALWWNRLVRNPFRMKRTMGTVAVTSVGMFGKVGAGSNWGIPFNYHPLTVSLGAVTLRPAVIDEHVEPREFVGMTLMFDHDVIDGAPMATFVQRLRELIESGYGL